MKKYLLAIGVNQYINHESLGERYSLKDIEAGKALDGPVKEISVIQDCLRTHYGYETLDFLVDATAEEIYRAVERIQKLRNSSQLLIYFSGHGQTVPFDDTAYWMASDAAESRYDRKGWIEYETIVGAVKNAPSQQVLIISNCCFAGRLAFKYRRISDLETRKSYRELIGTTAREVICSCGNIKVSNGAEGALNPFAQALVRTLKSPVQSCLTAQELFIATKVELLPQLSRKDQHPQHAYLIRHGHEDAAEFMFQAKGALAEGIPEGVRGDFLRELDGQNVTRPWTLYVIIALLVLLLVIMGGVSISLAL